MMQSLHIWCCVPWSLLVTLVVLCSSHLVLASQSCSLSGTTKHFVLCCDKSYHLHAEFSFSIAAAQFTLSTVTVSAESVDGPTPAARVTWSTTAPPECVASVRVEFRALRQSGLVTPTYTTNDTSGTAVIQTGLRCDTYYYITAVVTAETSDGIHPTLRSRPVQVFVNGGKV